MRAAAAEGYARLNQSSDVPKLQQAFDEEKKMPARLGAAFALGRSWARPKRKNSPR